MTTLSARACVAAALLAALCACSPPSVTPPTDTVTRDGTVAMDSMAGCGASELLCGSRCINTQSDPRNCGSCDNACPGTSVCTDGRCVPTCPSSQRACGNECVTLASDARHCGACGSACPSGQLCSRGACSLVCDPRLTVCGGANADAGADAAAGPTLCVDLQTDANHCGACNTACAAGQNCVSGACVTPCALGQMMCGGACVSVASNPMHCGRCGAACAAGQDCVAGMCRSGCPTGQLSCMSGCADAQNDPANCGACQRACTAGQVCQAGVCAVRCSASTLLCSGRCVNSQTDPRNCGTCGTTCAANQLCTAGRCVTECAMGNVACGALCVDTSADPRNCGACGNTCATGSFCSGGTCMRSCTMGATMCGAACADLSSDNANCGACGTACGAGRSCVMGMCATLAMVDGGCSPPSLQCGATCTDVRSDNNHCGRCGNACSADRLCLNGACVAPCATGEQRCGMAGTCTDVLRDGTNCGTCGTRCASGESCVLGTCAPDPSFRVTSLSNMGCTLSPNVEGMGAGDQRGLVVATTSSVLYSGDSSTVSLSSDLSMITTAGVIHDAMVGDLRIGRAYVMLNAMGVEPTSNTASTITQLGELSSAGTLTATRIPLSMPIALTSSSSKGFYSGYGRIVIFDPTGATGAWWQIAMPSGTVTRLTGTIAPTGASGCESWAHSGVAEFVGGEQFAVFVRNGVGVVRQRIRDGMQTTILSNTSMGDVCTVAFSPARNRWYFQYESAPSFAPPPAGMFGEFVVSCSAMWEVP
ncbi:MAG: MXAN_6577-like cysteine-rich protein [Deltaproteobacteria bacterium]|nr:MXAN_6577-like cysteine-rich protein [Deltaproteobacteria bacterium]